MLAQHFCAWLKHTCAARKASIPLETFAANPRRLTRDLSPASFFVDVSIPVSMKAP